MLIGYKRGQGSIILRVKILDSAETTGAGLTGLSNSSAGLIVSTIADNEATATVYAQASSNIETITTLGTFAAPTSGKCRFKEVDATNHKGVYEIQIADARFAVSSAKSLLVSISGAADAAETDVVVPLRDLDPYDAVRGGMAALPNAAADAAGGLPISDAGGLDLDARLDAAVSSRAAAATALSTTQWTNDRASNLDNLDAAVSTRSTLTEAQANAQADAALSDAGVTTTRTAYLDKLNITGNAASSAEVTAIQNNTRVRVIVPQVMERPDSGGDPILYKLHLYLYDTAGNMEAPDSTPTVAAENEEGTDRSANLGSVTAEATGHYSVTYEVDDAHAIEQVAFEWSVVEGGATRLHGSSGLVVDTTAVDFTSADRAKLDELHDNRLTSERAANLDDLDASISSRASQSSVDTIGGVTTKLDDTLEDDGGTFRFTANALEQAPSAGGVNPLVVASGTIGSTGNSTTALHLDGLTQGDDELVDLLLVVYDDSADEYHSRWIEDWALSSELATVVTLPFTPQDATDTYVVLGIRRDVSGGGGGLTEQDVQDAATAALEAYDPPTNTEMQARTLPSAEYATAAAQLSEAQVNAQADLALADAGVTTTRTAYLDKLNISGNAASSAEVLAIQNNTRVRVIVPQFIERPDAGDDAILYKLHLYLYDSTGNMEAPDSTPTIAVENEEGTDRSANLGTVTAESTGHYSVTYEVADDHAIEQLIFEWTTVEGGATRLHGAASQVVDTTAVDFTAADRTKLDTLHDTRLTAGRAANLDNLDAAISTRSTLDDDGVRGAVGLEAPDLDDQLANLATATAVQALIDLKEADVRLDKSESPYAIVWIKKGTGGLGVGEELLRQQLFDEDGNPIANIATFIAHQVSE